MDRFDKMFIKSLIAKWEATPRISPIQKRAQKGIIASLKISLKEDASSHEAYMRALDNMPVGIKSDTASKEWLRQCHQLPELLGLIPDKIPTEALIED